MSDQNNIVLLTIDSLRADHCGFMGEGPGHTPAMDRLADDGLVFTNAIAPGPATFDSVPVTFSGDFYPRASSGTSLLDKGADIGDQMQARDTIPKRLSRRGYETAAFTTNPWTSRQFDFDDGFDHFEDFMDADHSKGRVDRLLERLGIEDDGSPALNALEQLSNWQRRTNMFQSWDTFYDDVVAWTEQAEEPYFLWIFLVDAHMPFLPVDGFQSQSWLSTYAANLWLYLESDRLESVFRDPLLTAYRDTVEYADACLNQLTQDLADDDPIYVVHGDHGEEFGEHGLYGHGANLSEELIHTPLLVGNGPTGRVEQPFSLADTPRLLERLADDEDVADLARPVVQTRNQDPKMAVRGTDWKYVASEDEERLYRLTDDSERPITDPELSDIGRGFASLWRDDESERRTLIEAARETADSEPI